MNKSFLRMTLCALVLLGASTARISAQEKSVQSKKIEAISKSDYFDANTRIDKVADTSKVIHTYRKNRIPEFARIGISLGPEYNPKVSVGMRLNPLRPDDGFAPYLDVAYYPANTHIKRFGKEISNAGQLPSQYTVGLYTIPKVQISAYASNKNYTFGAGLALIRKELRGIPWHHDIHSRQISFSLRAGIHANAIFPDKNIPLELEAGVGYFRSADMTNGSWSKTVTKSVKDQVRAIDKDFISYEIGFVYWLK